MDRTYKSKILTHFY